MPSRVITSAHRRVPSRPPAADYDPIAWFYQKHWCRHYHPGLLAVLHRFLFPHLPAPAQLLDLGCGTGTLAQALVAHGFRVTGLDRSEQMLRYARQAVPTADFLQADMRQFRLPPVFQAALCTFDSLSHIVQPAELAEVFRNVQGALQPEGQFAFDLCLEEVYRTEWGRSCAIVEAEEAGFIRGQYDADERLGRTFITLFRQAGGWQRTDALLQQRCYDPEEIRAALAQAGFVRTVCYESATHDEIQRHLGPGRALFVTSKE